MYISIHTIIGVTQQTQFSIYIYIYIYIDTHTIPIHLVVLLRMILIKNVKGEVWCNIEITHY